ncbi:hypothetical protein EG68_07988 [Paragonimus skrjabini miyazakii]|uniref:ENTH domain-containing protein n=1 Tax=Paragonimus skrjabini miyazakii TaxID=59628 RepID=A0A8S9YKI9_9TREM|nr:hypothetical protein EG68_07988 [Paragonimus skrjabini miyazakii]
MFRDFINKGREIADKMTNIVMNFTETEAKVREATSDEAWGPHGQLLQQIADLTFTHGSFLEVMCTLWSRLHTESSRSWRRVYKSLILLDFLLKNGSEQVAAGAREHIYDLRTLESFQFVDENGKDQGINVRIKVQELIDLLQDPDRLNAERVKAKDNRHVYTGYGASCGSSWNSSFSRDQSSYKTSFSDHDRLGHDGVFKDKSNYNDDDYPSVAKPTCQSGRLGNFDDWHVGRERGVVDEMVEQIKEVWDTAKIVTKDLFLRKDSDVHVYEHNPRMVSEEMYEFPDDAVEVDGAVQSEPVHKDVIRTKSVVTQSFSSTRNHVNNLPNSDSDPVPVRPSRKQQNHGTDTETNEKPPKSTSAPRPPSVDLLGSWEEIHPSKTAPTSDSVDLLNWDGDTQTGLPWPVPNVVGSSPVDSLWPTSVIATPAQPIVSQPGTSSGSLFDTEFGDFVSAEQKQLQADPIPSLLKVASETPTATETIPVWPVNSTSFTAPSFSQPISSPQQPAVGTLENKAPSAKPIKVGSTWKELDSLKIDLDSLVVSEKPNLRSNTGPSLRQLQHASQQKLSPVDPNTTHFSSMSSTIFAPKQPKFARSGPQPPSNPSVQPTLGNFGSPVPLQAVQPMSMTSGLSKFKLM